MNYYKIVGKVTAKLSQFLKKLEFKNIKSFQLNHDTVDILMKNDTSASIKFLNPGTLGIYWTVNDFKSRAISKESEIWENIYDEGLFNFALHMMINHHDASAGITWNTVDFYLDEFCKY